MIKFNKGLKSVLSAIVVLSIGGGLSAFSADEYRVKLNGEFMTFDVPPVMIEDRILVPMRAIFEELGAIVDWEDETQTATGTINETVVSVKINEKAITKNGVKTEIDVPAQLVGGRTMVPVRAVSEAFLCEVDWNDADGVVIINETEKVEEVIETPAVEMEEKNTGVVEEKTSDLTDYVIVEEDGKYKINKKDKTPLINGSFEGISEINKIIVVERESGKKSTHKLDGELIMLADKVEDFGNGLLRCTYDNDTKYINSCGEIFESVKKYGNSSVAKLVTEEKYTFGDKTVGGRAYATYAPEIGYYSETNYYVILDENGNMVSDPYMEIYNQNDVYKVITMVKTVGIVSKNGDVIVPFKYNKITVLDKIYLAENDKKDVYIYDLSGKLLYEEPFSFVGSFSDSRAMVKRDIDRNTVRYGYIDENGVLINDLPYSDAKEFKNGTAKVRLDGVYVNIDPNGNIIE